MWSLWFSILLLILLPSLLPPPYPEMVIVSGAAPPNREWVNPISGHPSVCNCQQQQRHYCGPCCPWQPVNWLLAGSEPQPFPWPLPHDSSGKGRTAPLCWAPPPLAAAAAATALGFFYLFYPPSQLCTPPASTALASAVFNSWAKETGPSLAASVLFHTLLHFSSSMIVPVVCSCFITQ